MANLTAIVTPVSDYCVTLFKALFPDYDPRQMIYIEIFHEHACFNSTAVGVQRAFEQTFIASFPLLNPVLRN